MNARIRHGLVPAVPIPFRPDGTIHLPAQNAYLEYMHGRPVAGVAVWAHTGRGLHASAEQREFILGSWRAAMPDRVIVAGAGGAPGAASRDACLYGAMKMAEGAAKGGADALLAYPPLPARGMASADASRFIVEYHRALAGFGVPLILFLLYEEAGGIAYPRATIERLVSMDEVIGMKIATADSVITFQEVAATLAKAAPGKLVITGEDRFFGYSLMCGADAALVGMGSALPELQAAMMRAYFRETAGARFPEDPRTAPYSSRSFLDLSALVDAFGRATFAHPIQGYIRRMLWALVELGVIPEEAAHDPWGPAPAPGEREFVAQTVRSIKCQV